MSDRPPLSCGYAVDKYRPGAPVVVRFSVDRMALIVRNPNARVRKEAIVENRGITERTCSLRYFLHRQKIDHSLHNPPVLTSTITDLEFYRR